MKWLMRIWGKGKQRKQGFTLIELLFVVIVIAILAAAGIAMYMRAMDKARASEGLAVLGSLRTHYLVESADPTAPQPYPLAPTGGTVLEWGIETDQNKWWVEGAGVDEFTADFSGYTPATAGYLVALDGNAGGDLENISLQINVSTGDIVQTYP